MLNGASATHSAAVQEAARTMDSELQIQLGFIRKEQEGDVL